MASADHRSAAEIEREIEEERSALSRTLDEIHDRLSFESLSGELVGRVRDGGGEIGRTLARTARDNPIPFALTAIGLAWLVARHRPGRHDEEDPYARAAARPASVRWAEENRRDRDDAEDARDETRWGRARGAVSDIGEAAAETVRAGLETAGEAVEAGAAEARHYAADASKAVRRRAKGAYASAEELRHRIAEGTEDLSAAARKRVIAARTRAYEAQLRAEHYAARQRERATDFFDEQPLVAGALALAIGAAIGGLLPRTRREDGTLGSYRDQVFEEAERIYRDERDRLGTAARDLAEDVKGEVAKGARQAEEVGRSTLAEAEGKVRDAAERVADKARREAEKQGHG